MLVNNNNSVKAVFDVLCIPGHSMPEGMLWKVDILLIQLGQGILPKTPFPLF